MLKLPFSKSAALTAIGLTLIGGAVVAQVAPMEPVQWDKRRLDQLDRNVRRLERALTQRNAAGQPVLVEPDPEVVAMQGQLEIMDRRLADVEQTFQRMNADSEYASCQYARCFILGKVYNARWVLERATRDHPQRVPVEQLKRAVAYDKAVERGRSEERARIAQDLHDDIGARLLTLMYKAQSPEMESSLVPADWAVPVAAKASPPPRAMRSLRSR